MSADKPPEKPVPRSTQYLYNSFKSWSQYKYGQTIDQLLDVFVITFKLTSEEEKRLRDTLKALAPKKPPVPPKKPPEKPPEKPKEPPEPKPKEPPVPPAPALPKQPTVKPELVIARTPYPKWWKDSLNAKIDFTAPGSQVLATVAGALGLFVATIILTVTGETQISFSFGNAGSSGPIYLGGENQPMGMVIAMGNSPAPCGSGNLTILATDPNEENPSIGGWATCFVEETIKQKV